MYTLPSPWTSLRAAATFRVTWSGYVTENIDREGLGRRRTGTGQMYNNVAKIIRHCHRD